LRAGQTAETFILCDNPEAVNLSAAPKAKVIKGIAAISWLLGKALNGTTNPLVVIAWGHEASKPAHRFARRGPRLTPQILAQWRWGSSQGVALVLLFRGSGAFARDLAGAQRQILASDGENSFASDPISMPLLLKLAHGSPWIF